MQFRGSFIDKSDVLLTTLPLFLLSPTKMFSSLWIFNLSEKLFMGEFQNYTLNGQTVSLTSKQINAYNMSWALIFFATNGRHPCLQDKLYLSAFGVYACVMKF